VDLKTWPDEPLIPDDWCDNSGYLPLVLTRLSEGHCPKHATPFSREDGYCVRCNAAYELVDSSGTIALTNVGPGVFPRWAMTDGTTVMISREPNWGCTG
jgi:hypothetical protein